MTSTNRNLDKYKQKQQQIKKETMTITQRKDKDIHFSPGQGNDPRWEMMSGQDNYCRSLGQQKKFIDKLHLLPFFTLTLYFLIKRWNRAVIERGRSLT